MDYVRQAEQRTPATKHSSMTLGSKEKSGEQEFVLLYVYAKNSKFKKEILISPIV